MGDIGVPELIIVLIVVLVIFGPGRLPEVGKALGEAIRDFRAGMNEAEPRRAPQNAQPKDAVTNTNEEPINEAARISSPRE
jgi:sec-independent protein translocase protein TatA